MMKGLAFAVTLSSLLFAAFTPCGAEELRILRMTPAGEDVPAGRQIVFQFDRPVVPLGRMERSAEEIPIDVAPEPGCEWRWLNTSALACQLSETDSLKPATRYEVTVRPGITTSAGEGMSRVEAFRFVTARPIVGAVGFRTWKSPGLPVLWVVFNQPVTRPSAEASLFFRVGGREGNRIAALLEPDPATREGAWYLPLSGEKLVLTGKSPPRKSDDQMTVVEGIEARRVWLVTPGEELPPDRAVEFRIEPGLDSAAGRERGVEDRVAVAFDTFPAFRFLGVRCSTNTRKSVLIPSGGLSPEGERCDPLSRISLAFSAPVTVDEVKAGLTLIPDLAGGREDYDPWEKVYRYSRLGQPHRRDREYLVWIPETLRGYEEYRVAFGETNDEFGRSLTGPLEMSFLTDHRRPRIHLSYPRAVLEAGIDSEVPAVVTNLREISLSYDTLTTAGREGERTFHLPVPAVEDVAFAVPLQVRDLLDGRSGVVNGRVGTEPRAEISPSWANARFFAQVTPFQVHVKLGHFNTLVWVTDMASGAPVEGAKVRIYRDTFAALSEEGEGSHDAVTGESGLALLPGTETVDPLLDLHLRWDQTSPRLFVRVERGEDMALLPLDRQFTIDTGRVSKWSVWSSARRRYGHLHSWGTTAQGVYRLGDTMQYKLYVRDQDNETFVPAPPEGYTIEILDPTGKVVHEVPDVRLSSFGAFDGEFPIPERGAVGWYRFRLKCSFRKEPLEPMRVLVSDFTPSPFRVTTDLNGERYQPGDEVEVTTLAKMHAGGPYADARSRVSARLSPRGLHPVDPVAKSFYYDVFLPGRTGERALLSSESPLNAGGERVTRFTLPDGDLLYGRLSVESAVRDDRGKYVAARASAAYAGRDRFVGLRTERWLFREDEPADVGYLVVDEEGEPVAGATVTLTVERRETKASRVKGAGNAYLTQYVHSWVETQRGEGRAAAEPGAFSFVPDSPGTYRVTAAIEDTRGRSHRSRLSLWVTGKGRVVWEEPDDNSLSLVSEKETYQVGERARYLVRNPFPGARTLVTVERYGVLKSWVEVLEGSTPVIEFPVEEDYLPGFYLSVLVVSPRVEKPPAAGQVDLGKPAFRIGYAAVTVEDPFRQIEVLISPEREKYKPRETVRAEVRARPRQGAEGKPIELAVAVLDEAVFDLILHGKRNFDPYRGFYTLDGLDLVNFSLLTRLVGRQKFEKKGADTGGGGGAGLSLRSDFRFVSYWNPSLTVDGEGKADIEFELPDNLTGWRILVLAVTPGDRMGLGEAAIKVSRPTELRPAMPNQVTEGDRFEAAFSVMNRTDEEREITVSLSAAGSLTGPADRYRMEESLKIGPYKRETVWLPVQTAGPGEVVFTASAGDALDRDAVSHRVPVRRRRSMVSAATYGTIPREPGGTEQSAREPVLFPDNIHTDAGGVSVVGSPSVIGNLEGAFRYLRDYPYSCWEQILTKGTMAAHYQNLRGYIPDSFTWEGSADLPQDTMNAAASFQAPNGGMVYWIPRDRYVSPYLSAYTALAFNWLRRAGYEVPKQVEEKLHVYLDDLLRRDVVPTFYTAGMTSTVRAVALAALAEHGKVSLGDLERYRRHVPRMTLFGKAHYLLAALKVDGAGAIVREVMEQILAASSQSGGKFQFTEVLDDGYSRILATPLRTNCAILTGLTEMAASGEVSEMAGDEPFRLVRTITQTRGSRDHWENTQENIFCMNAVIDYSRVYEKVEPRMTFRAYFDDRSIGEARFDDLRDRPVTFRRPIGEGDPGRSAELLIEKSGPGRLYYAAGLQYAPRSESAERINAGIEIRREYSVEREGAWTLLESPMEIRRGELVRVDLFLSLPAARNFVVVDDPVPGGLEPVNRDLKTASTVDADKGRYQAAGGSWWFNYGDWNSYGVSRWSFYHQELRHDSVRFYSDYLAAGNYHLSYTAQAIAPGEFAVIPVHGEEMYDPDLFGKGRPAFLRVSGP